MAVRTELWDAGFESFEVKIGSAKVEFDGLEESTNKIKFTVENAGYKVVNQNILK